MGIWILKVNVTFDKTTLFEGHEGELGSLNKNVQKFSTTDQLLQSIAFTGILQESKDDEILSSTGILSYILGLICSKIIGRKIHRKKNPGSLYELKEQIKDESWLKLEIFKEKYPGLERWVVQETTCIACDFPGFNSHVTSNLSRSDSWAQK